jgi:hypothetical protein
MKSNEYEFISYKNEDAILHLAGCKNCTFYVD